MHRRYGDSVEFLAIYVREAHPINGWRMDSNERVGISVAQPRDASERNAVAHRCCSSLQIEMPLLVDDLDDHVGHAYSGMPDRLYIIDPSGRVAYKGGRGPFGFKPAEMEQALDMLLVDLALPEKPALGRVPALTNDAARKKLPPVESGGGEQLPIWARTLADTLPRTTAAVLELDYLHRARSPLDPKLRARMRWVAAHANRCAYGEAYALADLRRAGVGDAAIQTLISGDVANLPEAEKTALAFARKMTLTADTVTDEEVARLIELYGERPVVAMVQLLAYANFQDRLLLALDLPVEPDGPLPPVAVRFTKRKEGQSIAAARPAVPYLTPAAAAAGPIAADPEWSAFDFASLQQRMADQRARPPRIRVPIWDNVRAVLPPTYPVNRPLRIRWSLVCLGYQPELASAWFACLRTFAEEARQDRVFEESLFWVVTRSLHCFY